MIEEIFSFDKYEDFIRKISRDPSSFDPHFQYDEDNLYKSIEKENTRAFVVIHNSEVTGIFVWLILESQNYVEQIIGLSNLRKSIEEMIDYIEKNILISGLIL